MHGDEDDKWTKIASGSSYLGDVTIVMPEMYGATEAVNAALEAVAHC